MAPPRPTVDRIGLIGGECTGKSALAAALARELPACLVAERLRAFVAARGRAPIATEQEHLLLEQQAAEDELANTCPVGLVIADPAPLMTAVYSVIYFDDPGLLDLGIRLALGYSLIVWCDIDLPWEPDGDQRDGPEFRERAHTLLSTLVDDRLGPTGPPILRVSGGPDERLRAVRQAWRALAPTGPT